MVKSDYIKASVLFFLNSKLVFAKFESTPIGKTQFYTHFNNFNKNRKVNKRDLFYFLFNSFKCT